MKRAKVCFIVDDFCIDELDSGVWKVAKRELVCEYWSGEKAPKERHFLFDLLWSENAFYVRFEAFQHEPLVVSQKPNLKSKTIGLWERDVCEIFVTPFRFQRYFEFEVSPSGEWVDLEIILDSNGRLTNWDYESKMQVASFIAKDRIFMGMKIPWEAFNNKPQAGDIWFGNLFRCVGRGENRGYLAWSATETLKPNFHVPEKFGGFEFVR
ncbi:MAG: carbohydrate-binding family 9-like protein [Pyrinomonadaceae bacterium]|nr:carbohydrate-binding family 9-like protein [Pyrinomonadaceae bacterium]MCX7639483.1 carbohydrate-binding family 9-like protein [Pyrinomonadaceae bacterium]MDW8304466.1 carbohydrate-binding family 9-like protein [Acidobacteriota bacterium]